MKPKKTSFNKTRAQQARGTLRAKVLEQLEIYCNEAEHQDGYGYWEQFEDLDSAVSDFALYLGNRTSAETKKTFGFWCPGGRTGEVQAATPLEAARLALDTAIVVHFTGSELCQPWVYLGAASECKLWTRTPKETGPGEG